MFSFICLGSQEFYMIKAELNRGLNNVYTKIIPCALPLYFRAFLSVSVQRDSCIPAGGVDLSWQIKSWMLTTGLEEFFKSRSSLTEWQLKKHPSFCGGLCWYKWGLTMKRRRKETWAAELPDKRDGLTRLALHTMTTYTAAKVTAKCVEERIKITNGRMEGDWVFLNKLVLRLEDKKALDQISSSWVSFSFMLFSYMSWFKSTTPDVDNKQMSSENWPNQFIISASLISTLREKYDLFNLGLLLSLISTRQSSGAIVLSGCPSCLCTN